jgi:16S rRNA U516 pseudouridylate synthase RsuA-like enzyme
LVTGLLIMSQDGALVNRITSPSRKNPVGKVYEVQATNPFTGKEPELFEKGEILLTGNVTLGLVN